MAVQASAPPYRLGWGFWLLSFLLAPCTSSLPIVSTNWASLPTVGVDITHVQVVQWNETIAVLTWCSELETSALVFAQFVDWTSGMKAAEHFPH